MTARKTPMHDANGRSITVREFFENQMNERDRRYEERFQAQERAVTSALAAQKELTSAAFASSERAIAKAEEAQRAYNVSHNDLLRKMDAMIPRTEFDGRFTNTDEKIDELKTGIAGLRESRSGAIGEKQAIVDALATRDSHTSRTISLGLLAIGALQLILHFLR